MVRESHAGDIGELVGRAALGAGAAAVALLLLAFLAEVLRRRSRARRLLAILDCTLPAGVRTAAISLVAIAASFIGPRPAAADETVRGWLGHSSTPAATARPAPSSTTTTTTTAAPVATPDAVDEHAQLTRPTLTGPVVLIPPETLEQPGAPAPAAPVDAAPAVAPTATPSAVPPSYVVQRGDCLWSIAAARLGARATARAIDTSWRRIYDANRALIGDDPNLIHIGITLSLPPLDAQP